MIQVLMLLRLKSRVSPVKWSLSLPVGRQAEGETYSEPFSLSIYNWFILAFNKPNQQKKYMMSLFI
jgi:hypothetical protein